MSTTEPMDAGIQAMAEPWDHPNVPPLHPRMPALATAIVPKSSIAGRSLAAVVAIMTFLAALTNGAVMIVLNAASDWRSDVAREVTIQIRPIAGRDIEADVHKAAAIARATPGIAGVRVFSREESARLVEPWLGNGLNLNELPIPRMIVVRLRSGPPPDFDSLRKTLVAQVPSSSLDDHRRWIDRMRTMAGTAAGGGVAILALVLAATMLSVTFATRGAMVANRPIIEVLHYIGATDRFVGRQFQRHFLVVGFKGGAIGGGAAILLFGCAEAMSAWLAKTPGGDEAAALFGSFSIGTAGYLAILAQIVLMALVTAWASRHTVKQTLETID
ncbi:MAG: cell division protein FtsX [Pseudomonadota bacterium]